jgi:hypothetical protein
MLLGPFGIVHDRCTVDPNRKCVIGQHIDHAVVKPSIGAESRGVFVETVRRRIATAGVAILFEGYPTGAIDGVRDRACPWAVSGEVVGLRRPPV